MCVSVAPSILELKQQMCGDVKSMNLEEEEGKGKRKRDETHLLSLLSYVGFVCFSLIL